ncbi:MAG: NAD-dependent epimerase/dehydratase [Betaproteobacteria bacterium]|nr:NAD-dependent epimerase/dehydratase [Betaproteobacteria bacterium]
MTRRVLVTGSSGFIGAAALASITAEGWHAVGFDLSPPATVAAGAVLVRGDFNDLHQVYQTLHEHEIDSIVHCGGVSGPMLSRDAPFRVFEANVVGTANLLEAARLLRLRRFVFLSSAHAYGDTPPPPVPEDAPFHANDMYGATKASGDLLLRAYRAQYGLDAVALRISTAYGPGRRTRSAILTMIEDALAGKPTAFDYGDGYGRSYLYIRDAASAVVGALKAASFTQHAYNIAGAEFESMARIAEVVRKILPNARVTLSAGADPLSYRRERLDISAAKRDFGWSPQWNLERGIAEYAEWLRVSGPVTPL